MLEQTVERWEKAHREAEELRKTAIEEIDAEIRDLQNKRRAIKAARNGTAEEPAKKRGRPKKDALQSPVSVVR